MGHNDLSAQNAVNLRPFGPPQTLFPPRNKTNRRWPSGDYGVFCGVKHPLFVDEVLVHEATETVGVAKVTYYPVDGELKGIRMGLELANGTRRDFPLIELRQASPDEETTLKFVREEAE